jgi:putative peptidoglycan lipid II flippase
MARARGRSAALLVAAGILASRLFGLVRERVFAHYLGNSDAAGAFKAALRIPNLLQNLFGEGVLSASFIPVYARLLGEGRTEEARRVAGVVASLLLLVTSLLVAAGMAAAAPLTALIAPGFVGEVRELTVALVRVMFLGVGLLVLSAWCLGVLNSHRRFFLSYVAPVLWNVAQIAALVGFGLQLLDGTQSRAARLLGEEGLAVRLAWATVLGSLLQLLVQLPPALGCLGGLRPSLRLDDESRKVVGTFGPVLVGRGVVQLSAYIDQLLSSFLGPAVVSAMAYAQMLYLLPVSLFGMAVSAAELPEMARETAGEADAARAALRRRVESGARRVTYFVVPSAVAFVALGDCVVGALFQTGRFGASDTRLVWLILGGASVGLVGATVGRLLSSCLYALGDARTPLRLAVLRVVLTGAAGFALALPLRAQLGYSAEWAAAGLTASAGLAASLELALLRTLLARRLGPLVLVGRSGWVAWGAALGAGLLGAGARLLIGHPSTAWLAGPLVGGLLVLGLFGASYLAATVWLGHPEAGALLGRLPLLRRFVRPSSP